MKNKTAKILGISTAVLLLFSVFVVAGFTTTSSDETTFAFVEIQSMKDIVALREMDARIVYRYDNYALIETGDAERLEGMGMNIDMLTYRTELSVKGHAFDLNEGLPAFPEELTIEGYMPGTKGLYLVHMIGPIATSWRNTLTDMDVEILDYVPYFAYEVLMTPEQADRLKTLYFVDSVHIYQPGFKLAHDLRPGAVNIELVDGSRVLTQLNDAESFVELARMPEVYYISNYIEPKLYDEVASQIIGGGVHVWDPDNNPYEPYRGHGTHGAYVNQLGYTGNGVTIAIADTGIHPDHVDFQNRVIGGYSWQGGWNDEHGHGTHCAGSAAGNTHLGTQLVINEMWGDTHQDMGDFYAAQGLAYDSDLFSVRIFDGRGMWIGPGDNKEIVYVAREHGGAYVHSNSWGSESNGAYGASDSDYDTVVRDAGDGEPMIITVSAGNAGDGPSYQTTGSPGNAKNVITVGASENFLPGWQDADYYADPDRTAYFSSRGWTEDNRVKPDVQAPGFWIISTYYNPDDAPGDEHYAGMGGTSMSNPAVAGAAAVLVEWYETHHGSRPSPAMVKALMINTAYDLEDQGGDYYTGPIPNRDEGWGLVNLPMVIDPPVDFMLEDETSVIETGQIHEYEIECIDPNEPLKISLVWTDAPAAGGSNPSLRNDLDLEVLAPGGDWFRGNGFPTDGSGFSTYSYTLPNTPAMSTFDGNDDGWDNRNNVENVYIHPDNLEAGTYTVRIHADVPSPVIGGGQDYALVMYNAIEPGTDPSPLPPSDPSPIDGAVDVNTDTELSVYVEHQGGNRMNVYFHDASDHSLIGQHMNIGSGERASTNWNDLEFATTYGWYAIAEARNDGQTATSATWTFTTQNAFFDIPLYAGGDANGWNFVSFNLMPLDTSLQTILTDIDGNYDKLMYFDASTEGWSSYVPGREARYNTLDTWDHHMGIWIHMTTTDTLTIEGHLPGSTDLTLYPGWTMVSLPSSGSGNHGLPGAIDVIGYFDTSQTYNLAYDFSPGAFVFEPGKGYWIHNPNDTAVTWTVDY